MLSTPVTPAASSAVDIVILDLNRNSSPQSSCPAGTADSSCLETTLRGGASAEKSIDNWPAILAEHAKGPYFQGSNLSSVFLFLSLTWFARMLPRFCTQVR